MCGPILVDERLRDRIAAYAASPHQVSESPFGSKDEIGMLNLLSADTARELLAAADGGRVFDLGVDMFTGMPTWTAGGEPPFQIRMTHTPRGTVVDDPVGVGREQNELVGWSADSISMFTHCGTHIDTLNHYGYGPRIWNGFSADDHLGSLHWTVAGAERHPPIVARGILIDVAGVRGVDVLPDSYGIGEEDLRAALSAHHATVRPGDVVLVRTGRMTLWPDPERYLPREPGITREGAEFLARSGAIIVGADNIAVEQLPSSDPGNWMPVHTYLLAEAGVPIMEVVNLEELAAEECYEFAFIAAGLKLRGATAAPMRPIAMPLERESA
jgi:kynurenine formamidase